MAELLLEVRCQELPAEQVETLLRRLASRFFEEMMSRGLPLSEITTGGTCRRLALGLHGLPDHEPEREWEELGPPASEAWQEDGEPTEALIGFAARLGIEVGAVSRTRTERGEYAAAVQRQAGRPIGVIMAEMVQRQLRELPHRSDAHAGSAAWPRPVTGLVASLDGRVLGDADQGEASIELDGHVPTTATVGHPWLSPEPFEVASWADYVEALHSRGIVVSIRKRAELLGKGLAEQASELGGVPVIDPATLGRLAGSVEIPGTIGGRFDARLLALPEEMVITALATKQNVLAVRAPSGSAEEGELLPFFVAAVDHPAVGSAAVGGDGESETGPEAAAELAGRLTAGRERAVAGLLADLRFHVETDRGRAMARRLRRLEQMTFHPRLGTYAEKGQRLRSLVGFLAEELGWEDLAEAAREAATLMDADRTTAVVEAYPGLRGAAGGIYAREEGYVEAVWMALSDHRLPLGAEDPIPRHRVGRILAVADRLLTLVGYFGLGEVPTGSADPRGLRRRALGLLRIVLEGELSLDLDLLVARAVLLYDDRLDRSAQEILRDLQGFLDDRSTHLFGQRGFSPDEIAAAKAVGTADLPDLESRLEALRSVRGDEGFRILVGAAKRISNIVGEAPEAELDPALLVEEAERLLHAARAEVVSKVDEASSEGRYVDVLRHLLELAPALDRFFTDVLVMAEDEALRGNRIALLQACRRLYWRVARLQAVDPDRGAITEPRSPVGAVQPTEEKGTSAGAEEQDR